MVSIDGASAGGLSRDDLSSLLAGPLGKSVHLEVLRSGSQKRVALPR